MGLATLLLAALTFWLMPSNEPEGSVSVQAPSSLLSPPPANNPPPVSEPINVATDSHHETVIAQPQPPDRPRDLADIDYRPLLAQGKISKSELAMVLSSLSDAQLRRFLLNNTHLTTNDFLGYRNPTQAARTLVERWLNATETFHRNEVKLLFGTKSSIGTNRLAVQSEFSSEIPRLYTYYKVPDNYSKQFVFLKWTNTTNGTLWTLDKQPLTGTAPEIQQAWLRYTHGWPPGRYQVELISAEEGLDVLASQSFEVTEPETQ